MYGYVYVYVYGYVYVYVNVNMYMCMCVSVCVFACEFIRFLGDAGPVRVVVLGGKHHASLFTWERVRILS